MKRNYSFPLEERYFLAFPYFLWSCSDFLSSDGWCVSFEFLTFNLSVQEQAERGDLESLCRSVVIAGAADSVDIEEYVNPNSISMFSYCALRPIMLALFVGG